MTFTKTSFFLIRLWNIQSSFLPYIHPTGGIFGSSSIELVNIPEGVTFVNNVGGENIAQFAGNRQPRFTPAEDPFFFFHGQCVVSSGILEPAVVFTAPGFTDLNVPQPVISSQSCKLNACLGGGGFDCIAVSDCYLFMYNSLT